MVKIGGRRIMLWDDCLRTKLNIMRVEGIFKKEEYGPILKGNLKQKHNCFIFLNLSRRIYDACVKE